MFQLSGVHYKNPGPVRITTRASGLGPGKVKIAGSVSWYAFAIKGFYKGSLKGSIRDSLKGSIRDSLKGSTRDLQGFRVY